MAPRIVKVEHPMRVADMLERRFGVVTNRVRDLAIKLLIPAMATGDAAAIERALVEIERRLSEVTDDELAKASEAAAEQVNRRHNKVFFAALGAAIGMKILGGDDGAETGIPMVPAPGRGKVGVLAVRLSAEPGLLAAQFTVEITARIKSLLAEVGPALRAEIARVAQLGVELKAEAAAKLKKEWRKKGVPLARGNMKPRLRVTVRDKVASLNADLTRARAQAAGLTQFTWRSQGDDRVRPLHEDIDGEVFDYPNGHPTEGLPGQPPNCFVGDTSVWSPSPVMKLFSREYRGDLIRLRFKKRTILVTPNHPILTLRGFLPAEQLNESDYAVNVGLVDDAGTSHAHRYESRIDQVGNLGERVQSWTRSGARFHGDAALDDQINVVDVNGSLGVNMQVATKESIVQLHLPKSDGATSGLSALTKLLSGSRSAPYGIVGGGGPRESLLRSSVSHAGVHSIASAAHPHGALGEPPGYNGAGDAPFGSNALHGLALAVAPDQVLHVTRLRKFVGHVYNLETESGWYVASGALVSNCRCIAIPVVNRDAVLAAPGFINLSEAEANFGL